MFPGFENYQKILVFVVVFTRASSRGFWNKTLIKNLKIIQYTLKMCYCRVLFQMILTSDCCKSSKSSRSKKKKYSFIYYSLQFNRHSNTHFLNALICFVILLHLSTTPCRSFALSSHQLGQPFLLLCLQCDKFNIFSFHIHQRKSRIAKAVIHCQSFGNIMNKRWFVTLNASSKIMFMYSDNYKDY